MIPYLICISGFIGTGKSTLAKNLARHLSWEYLPNNLKSVRYLDDLFKSPEKWAFETQSSFLIEKSLQIIKKLGAGNHVILDRSLYEDIDIFATYFYEKGQIDPRAWETYQSIAKYFIHQLPKPHAVIQTYCDIDTSIERNKQRIKRLGFQHPEDYFKDIYNCYDQWTQSFNQTPYFRLNSDKYDLSEFDIIKEVANDLKQIFTKSNAPVQMSLFENNSISTKYSLNVLEEIIPVITRKSAKGFIHQHKTNSPLKPYVYIAAPFTNISVIEHVVQALDVPNRLLLSKKAHGKIVKGTYRDTLLKISRILNKKYGLNTLLPHKDVNKWGNKQLTAKEVFETCTSHVENCDFFLGILGESHGAHYEFGVAKGKSIPSVLIKCDEIQTSFIASDVECDDIVVFNCSKLSEIGKIIESKEFSLFLNSHLELKIDYEIN